MSRVVLDASAVLALLNGEPGSDKLSVQLLNMAASSTVNVAEVHAKLVDRGVDSNDAWEAALAPVRDVVDFTAEHARIAGSLIPHTRTLGLSLGDRACLALALSLKAPVYTTDKAWGKLRLAVPVHVIR